MALRVSHSIEKDLYFVYYPDNKSIRPGGRVHKIGDHYEEPRGEVSSNIGPEDAGHELLKLHVAEVHIASNVLQLSPYREHKSIFSDDDLNWHRWAITRIATGFACGDSSASMGMYHHALVIEGIWKANFVINIVDITDRGIRLRQSLNQPFSEVTEIAYCERDNLEPTREDKDISSVQCLAKGNTITISNKDVELLLMSITSERNKEQINFLPFTLIPKNIPLAPGKYSKLDVTCQSYVSFLQATVLGHLPASLTRSSLSVKQREDLEKLEKPMFIQHAWTTYGIPTSVVRQPAEKTDEGKSSSYQEEEAKSSCVIC